MANRSKNNKRGKKRGKFFENEYGNIFGDSLVTPIGRCQFVNIAEPDDRYKPAKYRLTILFDKSDKKIQKGENSLEAMREVAAEIAQYYLEQNGEEPTMKKKALRDGDKKDYAGFAGCFFISTSSKKRPQFFDGKLRDMDPAELLPGMKVRATVTPMLHDTGIAWQLTAVQFVEDDGVRYGQTVNAKQLMGKTEEGDDDDDQSDDDDEKPSKRKSKGRKSEEDDDDNTDENEPNDEDEDEEEDEDEQEESDDDDDSDEDSDDDEEESDEEDSDDDDSDDSDDDEESDDDDSDSEEDDDDDSEESDDDDSEDDDSDESEDEDSDDDDEEPATKARKGSAKKGSKGKKAAPAKGNGKASSKVPPKKDLGGNVVKGKKAKGKMPPPTKKKSGKEAALNLV